MMTIYFQALQPKNAMNLLNRFWIRLKDKKEKIASSFTEILNDKEKTKLNMILNLLNFFKRQTTNEDLYVIGDQILELFQYSSKIENIFDFIKIMLKAIIKFIFTNENKIEKFFIIDSCFIFRMFGKFK